LYGTCGGRGGCDGDGVCTTGNGDANEAMVGWYSSGSWVVPGWLMGGSWVAPG